MGPIYFPNHPTKSQIEAKRLISSHFEQSGAFMWTTIPNNRGNHFNPVDFWRLSNQLMLTTYKHKIKKNKIKTH